MPAPQSFTPTQAQYLEALEERLALLENPQEPKRPFAFDSADPPDAGSYFQCVALASDLSILVVSDGSDWIRQDDGSAI